MAEHENVYKTETERYHALVSFEDFHHNLAREIEKLIPAGKSVLESGAGTGRVTNLLLPDCKELAGFDLSPAMLQKARRELFCSANRLAGLTAADHRHLPVISGRFDWLVSGWSVCYLVSWQPDQWQQQVYAALREFLRVLRDDGNIMIIETLGTGKTSPEPPAHLVPYLDFLSEIGFEKHWLRTDYRFPDKQTARDLTQFFFGSEMLACIDQAPQPVLPECTGIWTCNCKKIKQTVPGQNQ